MAESRTESKLEFSLSEALIDPPSNAFPLLTERQPYESVQEPILLFRPPTKRKEPDKKGRKKYGRELPSEKLKKLDSVFLEFFASKKSKAVKKSPGLGTIYRSRSFDTLHRRLSGWDAVLQDDSPKATRPKTFIYNPKGQRRNTTDEGETITTQDSSEPDTGKHSRGKVDHNTAPLVPKRDSEIIENPYEIPLSVMETLKDNEKVTKTTVKDDSTTAIHTNENMTDGPSGASIRLDDSTKPGSCSSSPQTPRKPPRSTKRARERRRSLTELDIMVPLPPSTNQSNANNVKDVGLLKVKILGIEVPKKYTEKHVYRDASDDADAEVAKQTSTGPQDGLFCTLSINGKQSRFESSLSALEHTGRTAVWNDSEPEAVFYVSKQQQLFMTGRRLSFKDRQDISIKTHLSQNPKADCFGVGIYPVGQQPAEEVSSKEKSITNWTEEFGKMNEMTIPLDPIGKVLLGMSYILPKPCCEVSCSGNVTVKFVNGLYCFWDGEPCLTYCTMYIDNEDFGTTSSVLGLDDFLDKGFPNDTFSFSASSNTYCKIQVCGLGNDETEHWFAETWISLSTILPYSDHIVHQKDLDKPLEILEACEREIIMPLEPMGTIGLVFSLSPAADDNAAENVPHDDKPLNSSITEETIQLLEESGIFTTAAIAHFKKHSEELSSIVNDPEKYHDDISTIPEESSLESSREKSVSKGDTKIKSKPPSSTLSIKKKPTDIVLASGEFDHLEPTPTSLSSNPILQSITKSLKNRRDTIRLVGNLTLQVHQDYKEKKFKHLPDNFDPYREIEILKVEMKDIKARLAEAQFYREKAELKVKTLEEELQILKDKAKGKKRKYY